MRYEGGFQGRCNKLVDGCYSFWQAGLLPLLHRALFKDGKTLLYDLRLIKLLLPYHFHSASSVSKVVGCNIYTLGSRIIGTLGKDG